ncbi:MAG: hypothetical protein HND48_15100 [Chloroflexi bacterium]|nr:hypothetical protein [Chloroflexota bacterium]
MDEMPDFPEIELKERCREYLADAANEANRMAHDYIGVEHVFIAMTRGDTSLASSHLIKANLSPARGAQRDQERSAQRRWADGR